MIGQITPLVQAAKRTWIAAVIGHITGATLSAGTLGFLLGTCGLALGINRWGWPLDLIGGAILLLCALHDGDILPWPLLSLRRQTPAWFFGAFGPAWGAFAWGVDLGQGWTTNIIFAGYYGLVFWAVAGGSPMWGMILLGVFGLGRALPVLAAGFVRPNGIPEAIVPFRLAQPVNAILLAVVAGYFLRPW